MSSEPLASAISMSISGSILLEMIAFGMNGAALAAFGEIPAVFLTVALEPFGDRKEGVKLGDSTFNVFFDWLNLRLATSLVV